MSTLRILGALVRLHVLKVFADRTNLFWMFVMPMIFTVLMGMMFGGVGSGGGERQLPALVVSGGSEARELAARLEGSEFFRVEMSDTLMTEDQARTLVQDRRRSAVLVVDPAYADSLAAGRPAGLALFYDGDRASAQSARTAVEREVMRLVSREGGRKAGGDSFSDARFDSLWTEPRFRLEAETLGRLEDQPASALSGLSNGFQHTGPSYALMFVMMMMFMSLRDVVNERLNGTLKRLRLAAASPGVLAVGMFLGPLATGLIQFAVLLGLNALLPGMDYGDSPLCLAVTVVLYTAVCSAFALLLATFCRTPGQGDGFGMTGAMLMAALGGLWWPLEIVPSFMRDLGLLMPTGRGITIFHNMIGRGWGLAQNADHLLWLAGTLVLLLVLARARFHRLVD
ncbi:MAG TPA: ABC transporter permease [Candidatus Krumholzibacteria bacterium]|nr:ABC transporter permease [Candidatus Krumholzibacteria bacterium]HRX50683.1 ABC transporter permease [Candidatus Krumholzibacteria bacterium]